MVDDLVVVAGHCCLDIIPQLSALPPDGLVPGALIEAGPAALATGGAVSNVGLALHGLGVRVRLIGKIGDDPLGTTLLNLYRAREPALADRMVVAPGEATSYSIVISLPDRDRIFLHCPGANDTFGEDDVRDAALAGGRIFHFGYPPLMRDIYADGGKQLAAVFDRAHAHGMLTALDMALPDSSSDAGSADWRAFLYRVLPYVDLFLPSAEETLFMLDRTRWAALRTSCRDTDVLRGLDGSLLSRMADELLDYGAAVVGLKLGERGMYLRTTGDAARLGAMGLPDPVAWSWRELIVPCFQVDEVGTTGSGDATIAGLFAGILLGLGPEAALRSAVAVGACSVEQVDATSGIPHWDAVQSRLAHGWRTRPLHLALSDWRHVPEMGVWLGPHDRPI